MMRRCWWVLLAAALAGCGFLQAKPDPTRFYVLTSVVEGTGAPGGGPALGLGPIHLPSYLQRPELATRVGDNEVRFRPLDRWAGSLPAQLSAVLAEDLRRLTGAGRVVQFPWYSGTELDLVVELDVFRFEPAKDGAAHLLGHWRLREAAPAKELRSDDVDLSEKIATPDPDGEAAALSRVLGQLAQRIAAAVPPKR